MNHCPECIDIWHGASLYDGTYQPSLYNLNIYEIVHSVLYILSCYTDLNIAENVQAYIHCRFTT